MPVNPMDSWRGIVTALCDIFSQLSSDQIHTLQIQLSLTRQTPLDGPDASQHLDSEFADIDLAPIRQAIARLLFNSLGSVRIDVVRLHGAPALTSDASLMADEIERRIRSVLQSWDTQGILVVTYEDRTIRGESDSGDEENDAEETDEDSSEEWQDSDEGTEDDRE